MKTYTLQQEQYLPITVEEAWQFFSSAQNLAKITPPDMAFKILTPLDGSPIYEGMLINYIIRPMLGIPMKWETVIGKVNAPTQFTDMQQKGPYALWEHTHTFLVVPGGVLMTDEVKYALPLGILGDVAHGLFIKKKLDHIFAFRKKVLEDMFGTYMRSR